MEIPRTEEKMLFQCKSLLKQAGLICLQTDTVPGLAVGAYQEKALQRLYAIKGRDKSKKLVWMLKDIPSLYNVVNVPEYAEELISKYWPGALTIVFQLKHSNNNNNNKSDTQAFRFADDDFLQKLLHELDEPLAVSSVNKSGERELLDLADIQMAFGESIDFFAWRNRAMSGRASTVVDATTTKMRILRQGELRLN